MDDLVQDWEKRWRKSVLPFAALAALGEGPKHGYGLAVALRDVLGAAAPPSQSMELPRLSRYVNSH